MSILDFFPMKSILRTLFQLTFVFARYSSIIISDALPLTNIVFDPHSKGVFLIWADYTDVAADSCSIISYLIPLSFRNSIILLKTTGDYFIYSSVFYYWFLFSIDYFSIFEICWQIFTSFILKLKIPLNFII